MVPVAMGSGVSRPRTRKVYVSEAASDNRRHSEPPMRSHFDEPPVRSSLPSPSAAGAATSSASSPPAVPTVAHRHSPLSSTSRALEPEPPSVLQKPDPQTEDVPPHMERKPGGLLKKAPPPLQPESPATTETPAAISSGHIFTEPFSPVSTIDLNEEAPPRKRTPQLQLQSPHLATEPCSSSGVEDPEVRSDPGGVGSGSSRRPNTGPAREVRQMNFATALAQSLATPEDGSSVSSLAMSPVEKPPPSSKGFHAMLQDGYAQRRIERDRWFAALSEASGDASGDLSPGYASLQQARAQETDSTPVTFLGGTRGGA